MNRCLKAPVPGLRALACTVFLAITPWTLPNAWAQAGADIFLRHFPEHARRGVLKVTNPPEIVLDGTADRLSPGSRIRSTDNLIVMPNLLVGRTLRVNYTREPAGMVHEVWVLTPAELSQTRASNPDYVERNYQFQSEQ